MKRIRKNLLFCFIVIILSFGIVLFSNKTYMINTFKGEYIYVEDLKVGDFIENGAVLYVSSGYHFVSGRSLHNKVWLCFAKGNYLKCSWEDSEVSMNSSYKVLSYDEHFGVNSEYDGWVFKGIYNSDLVFVPSNAKSVITQNPNMDNDYEVCGKCTVEGEVEYNWFKEFNITDYSVSSDTDEKIELESSDGILLLDRTEVNEDNDIVITFEFEANKGDIISFETRGSSSFNYAASWNQPTNYEDNGLLKEVYLNDNKVLTLSDNYLFNRSEIKVNKTGVQKLQFVLEDAYYYSKAFGLTFYIKDLKLLSFINNGDKLDYSKVKYNDTLSYSMICPDGYLINDSFVFDKEVIKDDESDDLKENEKEENAVGNNDNTKDDNLSGSTNDNEKNPNTADVIVLVLSIMFVSFVIGFVVFKKIQFFKTN